MYDQNTRLVTILGLLMAANAGPWGGAVEAGEIHVPGDEPSIQAGINAAVAGDVVIVAPDIYNEFIDFGGKAITVRSTDPDDPAVVMSTVINGLGFLHTVIFADSEEADSVLKGFVITGGNATAPQPNDRGGGVVIISASPTIENCTITANQATLGGGLYVFGGSPTIRNCLFSGNGALFGGGCFNEAAFATYDNVQFCNNIATSSGGGCYNFNGDATTYQRCTFSRNSAAFNGGGIFNDTSNPTASNTGYCGNLPDAIFGSAIVDNGGNSFLYCAPPSPPVTSPGCAPDLDGSGSVTVIDLLAMLAAWGPCP